MSVITEIYQERYKFFMGNDTLSDVKFVFLLSIDGETSSTGKRVIPTHRFFLAIASPLFSPCFAGV